MAVTEIVGGLFRGFPYAEIEGKNGTASDCATLPGLDTIGAGCGLQFWQGHDDLLFVWGGRGEAMGR